MNRSSRHKFSTIHLDANERLFLSDREPFLYRDLADNRLHSCKTGETLWNLAGLYYGAIENGCNLWWIIGDFQPEPIHDPTIAFEEGKVLVIPSLRTVEEQILNEVRRRKGSR